MSRCVTSALIAGAMFALASKHSLVTLGLCAIAWLLGWAILEMHARGWAS